MKQALGILIGVILGWWGGVSFDRMSSGQLIDRWREIRLGAEIGEVTERFGDALYRFEPGEEWPDWARGVVPHELSGDLGLLVFYVKDRGPNLFLVVFDREGKVSFVSSVPT